MIFGKGPWSINQGQKLSMLVGSLNTDAIVLSFNWISLSLSVRLTDVIVIVTYRDYDTPHQLSDHTHTHLEEAPRTHLCALTPANHTKLTVSHSNTLSLLSLPLGWRLVHCLIITVIVLIVLIIVINELLIVPVLVLPFTCFLSMERDRVQM